MRDRFVIKRYMNIMIILLAGICYPLALGGLHQLYADEIILLLCISLMFLVLFVLALENNRTKKKLAGNRENDYGKTRTGFVIAVLIMIVSSFLPEFLKPALLAAIIMTGFTNREIAMCVGIFLDMILCLTLSVTLQEAVMYCLLTLFGCLFTDTVRNKKTQIWCVAIIFSVSAIFPQMFYYLAYHESKDSIFLYGMIEGLCCVLFLLLCYYRLANKKDTEVETLLNHILEEEYPLVQELKSFSKAEYEHARRVSREAEKCAKIVGADEKVCAAAGFYYRIGIIEGSSIVKDSIRLTQEACFPEGVVRIVSEYNGEEAFPSSVESAIVHMVDGLIKKMEVLKEQKSMASEWNQDMVIYQTLNEFSAQGLYDKSGLSMNMFLKIREYLVKEEALL